MTSVNTQHPINVNKLGLNVTIKADTFNEGRISDILFQHFSTSSVLLWTCKLYRILRTQLYDNDLLVDRHNTTDLETIGRGVDSWDAKGTRAPTKFWGSEKRREREIDNLLLRASLDLESYLRGC